MLIQYARQRVLMMTIPAEDAIASISVFAHFSLGRPRNALSEESALRLLFQILFLQGSAYPVLLDDFTIYVGALARSPSES